eukprot:908310-Rhodomonas_salina.1
MRYSGPPGVRRDSEHPGAVACHQSSNSIKCGIKNSHPRWNVYWTPDRHSDPGCGSQEILASNCCKE